MDFGSKVFDLVNHDEVSHSHGLEFATLSWREHVHYSDEADTDSGIPFAIGLLAILQGAYQYLMDAYGPFAASAVSPSSSPLHLHPHRVPLDPSSN
jgi:hypothetical protein